MNLGTIRTEVSARGFDYLTDTRLNQFINRAYFELCEEQEWPFLATSTTGTAPLTITDLRTIESVTDTTTTVKLKPLDRRHLTDFVTLSTTGSPEWYYKTGLTTVAVYPANTSDTLEVYYWKVPTGLTTDSDEPVLPARFHHLLTDGATVYCYMDSDEPDAALRVAELYEAGKERMVEALLNPQSDRTDDFIVQTEPPLDS